MKKNYELIVSPDQKFSLRNAIDTYYHLSIGFLNHKLHDIALSYFCKFNKDLNCQRVAHLNFTKIHECLNGNYHINFKMKSSEMKQLVKLEEKFTKSTIIINKDELDLLIYICDYVSRIYFGDLSRLADTLAENFLRQQDKYTRKNIKLFEKSRDVFGSYLEFIKMYFYNLSPGSNWGVRCDDNLDYEGTFLFDCYKFLYSKTNQSNRGKNQFIKHTPSKCKLGKKLIRIKEIVK